MDLGPYAMGMMIIGFFYFVLPALILGLIVIFLIIGSVRRYQKKTNNVIRVNKNLKIILLLINLMMLLAFFWFLLKL